MTSIDPASTSPGDVYKILVGAVVPRPIAFVSSIGATGLRNLAPFSFFNIVSVNPPVVGFSVSNRGKEGAPKKDTLRNVEETREFVVNIVGGALAAQVNATSAEVAPDIDEFTLSGLTPMASEVVQPPRVAESLVQMECRLVDIVRFGAQPLAGNLVLGEILRIHVADGVMEQFRIDPEKLDAIGRMAGATYASTRDRFDLVRPA